MASDDTQIRTEMEQSLLQDTAISQAAIINLSPTPKDASTAQWTAVLALDNPGNPDDPDAAIVSRARKTLRKQFPASKTLVPKAWSIAASLPQVAGSTSSVDTDALRRKLLSGEETTEEKIQRIVAFVLHKPLEDVPLTKSYVNIGGDSITAVEVMARCAEEEITLHVLDILNAESLAHLAVLAADPEHVPGALGVEVAQTGAPAVPVVPAQ